MDVLWQSLTTFPSQVKKYKGKETYRLVGRHLDEFGEWKNCKCYVGEYFDNFDNTCWRQFLNDMTNNRGRYYLVSGMKFKKRNEGLFSADSKPCVLDSIDKKDWNTPEKVVESVKEFEHDLFLVD